MEVQINVIQKKKLFAQHFGLWLAIATFIMMFGGFTSAYIVKKANVQNWNVFALPVKFIYSTSLIILSSLALVFANNAYRRSAFKQYGRLLGLTLFLGIAFVFVQVLAWIDMANQGLMLNDDTAAAFLYIITGIHALHVLFGLFILFYSWVSLKIKIAKGSLVKGQSSTEYGKNRIHMVATYWHFVDFLWIYLFLFLLLYR